jgi:hypothetical protein
VYNAFFNVLLAENKLDHLPKLKALFQLVCHKWELKGHIPLLFSVHTGPHIQYGVQGKAAVSWAVVDTAYSVGLPSRVLASLNLHSNGPDVFLRPVTHSSPDVSNRSYGPAQYR